MVRTCLRWSNAAALLLAAVAAMHVWRAANNSITTDEAFTYNSFVSPPLLEVLTHYDANHHVLHSLLCKLSVTTLGANTFTLRLPSLLAAFAFLFLSWRLAREWFGDTPLMAAVCAVLALHPAYVDYFSLARGYSLAMAFLMWALLETQRKRWSRVSLALGLAVASNPVFAIPAAAWIGALLLLENRWRQADELILPGAVTAFLILVIPVLRATGDSFYYGTGSLHDSVRSLLEVPSWDLLSTAMMLLVPVLLTAAMWFERGTLTVALVLCLAAVASLHLLFKTPWPFGRTGIYLIPFVILLIAKLAERWSWSYMPLAAASLVFASTVTPGFYRSWPFDADNREVMETLRTSFSTAKVTADFPLERGCEFYRRTMHLDAWPEVTQREAGTRTDVYVLRTDEIRYPRPEGLRVIRRFPRSGAEIAVTENFQESLRRK